MHIVSDLSVKKRFVFVVFHQTVSLKRLCFSADVTKACGSFRILLYINGL